jgi:hypothetical protein
MSNVELYYVPTRRQAMIGVASLVGTTAMSGKVQAFWPWLGAFSAAAAAGWLVEALKNWGFVPDARTTTAVRQSHIQAIGPLQQQGYTVQPKYSGFYSGGDFELSEARRGDDLLAFGTTSHGHNTCTLTFDKADSINLGLVASALRKKGFDPGAIEASTLPVHPPGTNQYFGSRRQSPTYMTPSHGTIDWSTDVSGTRPNFVTSIRSDLIAADLHFVQDAGRWTYKMERA